MLTVDQIEHIDETFTEDGEVELDENDDEVVVNAADSESKSGNPISVLKVDKNDENIFIGEGEDQLESDQGKSSELILTLDQDVVNVQDTTLVVNSNEEDEDDGLLDRAYNLDQDVPIPKSVELARNILSYPLPPQLDFSDQTASKASVILVQTYLQQNPTYPLKKKIETNLNNQIIPKLCNGIYQLKPSTLGYTLFDAKVVPWNGKDGWLRYKTKYAGIIRYDTVEESKTRKDIHDRRNELVSIHLRYYPNQLPSIEWNGC